MYATYAYYVESFFGSKIDGTAFPRLMTEASDYVDMITRNRAKNHADSDAVKKACCAVAEVLLEKDKAFDNLTKESESVGSYRVSYRNGISDFSGLMYSTARQYLLGTGLLYRGGC